MKPALELAPAGEEIQRISRTKKSAHGDSNRRRSNRLSSILGRGQHEKKVAKAGPSNWNFPSIFENIVDVRIFDREDARGDEPEVREQNEKGVRSEIDNSGKKSSKRHSTNAARRIDEFTGEVSKKKKTKTTALVASKKASSTMRRAIDTSSSESAEDSYLDVETTDDEHERRTGRPHKSKLKPSKSSKVTQRKGDPLRSMSLSSTDTGGSTDGSTSTDPSETSSDSYKISGFSDSSTSTSLHKKHLKVLAMKKEKRRRRKHSKRYQEDLLAKQATEFVSMIVNNLNLAESLTLPPEVKEHAKSAPISLEDGSVVHTDSDSDDDSSSEDSSPTTENNKQNKKEGFRSTTLGRRELMLELKEKAKHNKSSRSTPQNATSVLGNLLPICGRDAKAIESFWGHKKVPELNVGSAADTEISLAISSDSQSSATGHDDGVSLEYSLVTEEEKDAGTGLFNRIRSALATERTGIETSGSDDSSMVAVRHGHQGDARSTMPKYDGPEQNSRKFHSGDHEPDDLQIKLSLSGESNDLIRDNQSKEATDGFPSARNSKGKDAANINGDPKLLMKSKEHQKELRSKIAEFQHRLSSKNTKGVHYSPVYRNVKQLPAPQPDLPKASNKIAQAYVDALSKKTVSSNAPNSEQERAGSDLNGTFSGSLNKLSSAIQSLILSSNVGTEASNGGESQPAVSILSGSKAASDVAVMARRSMENYPENDTIATSSIQKERAVDYDNLVTRIDGVVNRLITAKQHNPQATGSQRSELEQRTLKDNTSELLRNLSILRARRSSFGRQNKEQLSSGPPMQTQLITHSAQTDRRNQETGGKKQIHTERKPSFDNSNLAALRARRNQAAIAIRNSAEKLNGWSTKSEVNKKQANGLEDTTKRSRSSAKLNGPPRPESFSSRRSSSRESSPTTKHVNSLDVSGANTMPSSAVIDLSNVDQSNFHSQNGANREARRPGAAPYVVDLTNWEEEQLQHLPIILNQSSLANLFDSAATEDEEYDASYQEFDRDGALEDNQRLDRIDNMIKDLKAQRQP